MLTVRVLPRRGVALRSSLSTVEVVLVLVAAHTWAGGRLPAPGFVAVAAALVFAAGLVVLRGRVPLRAAVPALVTAQLLLHCWMAVVAAGEHVHGGQLGLTWPMLLAHVAGGVATAIVWELRRRAVEVLVAWSAPGLLPVPLLRRVAPRPAPVLLLRRPLVVVPLRGPPLGPALAT